MGFDAEFKAEKKKRANRSAKLKQCKLYARREQWLSHVKKNGYMSTSPTFPQRISEDESAEKESSQLVATASLEHSDPVSPTHHQNVNPSRKKCPSNNTISSSGSSYGSCSRSVSDADEEDTEEKGGSDIDDWESVADALSITVSSDNSNEDHIKSTDSFEAMTRAPDQTARRAWRPDDVSRPQTLPNLLKQQSFPTTMEKHYNLRVLSSTPSSCPICYEELDLTDSSFLPCFCGFRLCLFCHKRILEADARCPGCRKQYIAIGVGAPPLSYRLTRSCSVVSR